jgi:hypothetical protein
MDDPSILSRNNPIIYNPQTHLDYMKGQRQHPWTHSQADQDNILMIPETDMDHFPYTRFYRGKHREDEAFIHNRRAGYRKRRDILYKSPNKSDQCDPYLRPSYENSKPFRGTIFQTSCNQSYPSHHPDVRNINLMSYDYNRPLISNVNR